MSREIWERHYVRRLEEARKRWPVAAVADFGAIDWWASERADEDTREELGDRCDQLTDDAKEPADL